MRGINRQACFFSRYETYCRVSPSLRATSDWLFPAASSLARRFRICLVFLACQVQPPRCAWKRQPAFPLWRYVADLTVSRPQSVHRHSQSCPRWLLPARRITTSLPKRWFRRSSLSILWDRTRFSIRQIRLAHIGPRAHRPCRSYLPSSSALDLRRRLEAYRSDPALHWL